MTTIVDSVFRGVLRNIRVAMVMAVLAIFVACIFSLAIGIALMSVVWSLVRGRKPAAFTVFQYVRQASRKFDQRAWTKPAPAKNEPPADIVDVQVHEVHKALPSSEKP